MNTDIQNAEFSADRHPDENQLLLALEGELSPGEIAEVERHISTCWDCRARYHEMHRGILAFVEYREKLYLPELDAAPGDFHQFRPLLNQAAVESPEVGLLDRIRSFFSFAQLSLQTKWVTATAVVMMVILFWTQVLNPTTLSASELLTKAVQSQNPPSAIGRKVRQRVRVKTAGIEIVREFQWETGAAILDAKWGTDPENWTTPMTAQGFSQWHDSLSAPKDKVTKSEGHWTLDTIAPAGPIKEASIVIRAGDFHPTQEHILFSDNRTLDLQEISFDMADLASSYAPADPRVQPAGPIVARQSNDAGAGAAVQPLPVNLEEAELELRYAMFAEHLDEDEDLQISRAADAVIVSGIANSAERMRQLQASLAGLPGVRLSVSEPGLPAARSASAPSKQTPNAASAPLLKDRLDSAFASPEARRDFVDSCLSISDSAVSNAWALKKLTERYTDDFRSALKPESRVKVDKMIRGHLQRIAAANARLNTLLDLLPPSQPSGIGIPQGFRAAAAALFDLVQRQDSLVAALVAGTQATNTAAIASSEFRSAHEAITRIAGELNSDGGNSPK
jgi:hypothetical protein